MENTSFNFGIESTENIDLENALTQHLQSSDELVEITEEKDTPKASPSKAKPSTVETKEEDVISEDELKNSLLTALEDKPEEKEVEVKETEEELPEAALIAEDYYRLGLLTGDKLEIKTHEELLEAVETEFDKRADDKINAFIGSKGEKVVNWFKACVVNGVDPETYFAYDKNIESVKGLDMEDVNVQKNVVRKHLTEVMKMTPARAEKYLTTIEAAGELDAEAVSAQEQLISIEEKELQLKIAQKEKEANYKKQEATQYVNNVHNEVSKYLKVKEIDGLPLTDKIAQEVYDEMTTKKWKLPNGDEISDFDKFILELRQPENIKVALQIALLKRNGFDFSKVKQKAISEEKTKFFSTHAKKEKEVARKPFDQFKIEI